MVGGRREQTSAWSLTVQLDPSRRVACRSISSRRIGIELGGWEGGGGGGREEGWRALSLLDDDRATAAWPPFRRGSTEPVDDGGPLQQRCRVALLPPPSTPDRPPLTSPPPPHTLPCRCLAPVWNCACMRRGRRAVTVLWLDHQTRGHS